ncbi:MAG: aminopeptidase N, partial [Pseudomonadota bacterium]
MRPEDAAPRADKTIRLSDYTPPAWTAEETRLVFDLRPDTARVTATIRFRRTGDGPADLRLDGHSITLVSAAIDGRALAPEQIAEVEDGVVIDAGALPADSFEWACETAIDAAANTSLEGLYMSNGMYCTQCEAEGFRKITYYPDRP